MTHFVSLPKNYRGNTVDAPTIRYTFPWQSRIQSRRSDSSFNLRKHTDYVIRPQKFGIRVTKSDNACTCTCRCCIDMRDVSLILTTSEKEKKGVHVKGIGRRSEDAVWDKDEGGMGRCVFRVSLNVFLVVMTMSKRKRVNCMSSRALK